MNIPKTIKVGYQKRSDTYTGRLAYVIWIDAKGKIRQVYSAAGFYKRVFRIKESKHVGGGPAYRNFQFSIVNITAVGRSGCCGVGFLRSFLVSIHLSSGCFSIISRTVGDT